MDVITQAALVVAFFTALKAIQHKGDPGAIYMVMSIVSWVALTVGLVLWLIK